MIKRRHSIDIPGGRYLASGDNTFAIPLRSGTTPPSLVASTVPSPTTSSPTLNTPSEDESSQMPQPLQPCESTNGPCPTDAVGNGSPPAPVHTVDEQQPMADPFEFDSCPSTPQRTAPTAPAESPSFRDELQGQRTRVGSAGTFGQNGPPPPEGLYGDDLEPPSIFSSPLTTRESRRRTISYFSPGGWSSDGSESGTTTPRSTSRRVLELDEDMDDTGVQLRSTPGRSGMGASHLGQVFDLPSRSDTPVGYTVEGESGERSAGLVSPPLSGLLLPEIEFPSGPPDHAADSDSDVGDRVDTTVPAEPESRTNQGFYELEQPHPNLSCLSFPELHEPQPQPSPQMSTMNSDDLHSTSHMSEPRSSEESMRTASGLLPSRGIARSHAPSPLPLHARNDSSIIPSTVAQTTFDMSGRVSPSKKAQLVRSARKAEQTLGEALSEDAAERYIVDPSTTEKTIMTHFESGWPESPDVPSNVPEWERQDCVPRKRESTESSDTLTISAPRGPLGWIRDLTKTRKVPSELRVRIEREVNVAETWQPGAPASTVGAVGLHRQPTRPKTGPKGRKQPPAVEVVIKRETSVAEDWTPDMDEESKLYGSVGGQRAPPGSAISAVSSTWTSTSNSSMDSPVIEEDQEEIARRARRLQLAKLQRLLGTQVPLHMLSETGEGEGASIARSASIDSRRSWSRRFSAMTLAGPKPDPVIDRDLNSLSAEERVVARKRATKLEQVFGETPPQDMFLPSVSTPPRGHSRSNSCDASEAFVTYRDSITQLINLVENDQDRLASIVDELDRILPCEVSTTVSSSSGSPTSKRFGSSLRTASLTSLSPTSPMYPNSQQAALRRNRKLTRFFGERYVDLSQPYAAPPVNSTRRLATLDGVLKEMWQNVQAEVGKGSLRTSEANKLVDMMGNLTKKKDMSSWAEL